MGNLKNILERFLIDLKVSRGFSRHTIRGYQVDLLDFMTFLSSWAGCSIDELDLSHLQRGAVQSYLVWLHNKGYQPSTLNRRLSALRSFTKFLVLRRELDENPFEGVRNVKSHLPPPDYLTRSEINKVFEVLSTDTFWNLRDFLLVLFMYGHGLRVGELTGMKTGDIDVERRVLRVVGKGGKMREIPVLLETLSYFHHYLIKREQLLAKFKREHMFLWINRKGDPLTDRGVRYILRKLGQKAGLMRQLHPHTLRHTYATHLLQSGVHLRVLQELLGHARIQTTERYTHPDWSHVESVYHTAHPGAEES